MTYIIFQKGKMVNLMFGANAPKLTNMIIDELKMEQAVLAGEKQRETYWEITDLSPDEQVYQIRINLFFPFSIKIRNTSLCGLLSNTNNNNRFDMKLVKTLPS